MILLRVPGTLEYRNLALRAISEVCRIVQRDDWEGAALEAQTVSALGEAFNNVAIHAYAEGPPGDAIIEISWNRNEIVIQITDMGRSFDPNQIELPDLDSLPEGGMGLFIIRSFMDDIDYQAGPPNVLRMIKRRASRTEGEVAHVSTHPSSKRSPSVPASKRSGSQTGESHPPSAPPSGSPTSRSGWRMTAVKGDAVRKIGGAR